MKNILVLYTEYAPYVHACIKKLTSLYKYKVYVVRYPVDKNAPFKFESDQDVILLSREDYDNKGLIDLFVSINPQCIIVSGWIDKGYNKLTALAIRNKIQVIGIMDNLWVASYKQKFLITFGKRFIKNHFSQIWIPGIYQYEYARKLGFSINNIITGYYSADSDLFSSPINNSIKVFNKRFLYVGRLLKIKGTDTLVKAIEKFYSSYDGEWEFLIIGNGEFQPEVLALTEKYKNVFYKPFMAQTELAKEGAKGGVFVLPSNYDAWGVVVHEYALMGYPFILSSMVGSRNYFVSPGYNGFIFKAGDPSSLTNSMKKIVSLSDEQLFNMSNRSIQIGNTLNSTSWACRLDEAITNFTF